MSQRENIDDIARSMVRGGMSKANAATILRRLGVWIENTPTKEEWRYGGTNVGSICETVSASGDDIRRELDDAAQDLELLPE